MEGEPKVKNIVALAEKVLPNTAPQGKDSIVRETEALRADWEAFVTALQKVSDYRKTSDILRVQIIHCRKLWEGYSLIHNVTLYKANLLLILLF